MSHLLTSKYPQVGVDCPLNLGEKMKILFLVLSSYMLYHVDIRFI